MLRAFLATNRSELIGRCRAKVAQRREPRATPEEMEHGIPLFLDQLMEMLPSPANADGRAIPGEQPALAEARLEDPLPGPTPRGTETFDVMRHDFTIDQVVHDYGDLCQSITQLAFEQEAAVGVDELGILNITLDNAIAGAMTEYEGQRQRAASRQDVLATDHRLGLLANELRRHLNTAIVAVAAIRSGSVGSQGATAAALDRSLMGMRGLIDQTLAQVRLTADSRALAETFEIGPFVADVQVAAALEATTMGCELTVHAVQPGIFVRADRHILGAAVSNVLHTAFRYTRGTGHVLLTAYAEDGLVFIEIEDAGGLPQEMLGSLFRPHDKQAAEHGGGPALAVSRMGVEANGGQMYARNVPGRDAVVTIELPLAA